MYASAKLIPKAQIHRFSLTLDKTKFSKLSIDVAKKWNLIPNFIYKTKLSHLRSHHQISHQQVKPNQTPQKFKHKHKLTIKWTRPKSKSHLPTIISRVDISPIFKQQCHNLKIHKKNQKHHQNQSNPKKKTKNYFK